MATSLKTMKSFGSWLEISRFPPDGCTDCTAFACGRISIVKPVDVYTASTTAEAETGFIYTWRSAVRKYALLLFFASVFLASTHASPPSEARLFFSSSLLVFPRLVVVIAPVGIVATNQTSAAQRTSLSTIHPAREASPSSFYLDSQLLPYHIAPLYLSQLSPLTLLYCPTSPLYNI